MIQRQRGAVLIVSLVLLLIITAIAASMLTSSTFQTKISSNAQRRESVFRVAESATEQLLPLSIATAAAAVAATPTAGTVVAVTTSQSGVSTPTAKVYYGGDGLSKRQIFLPGVALGGDVAYVARTYEVRGDATTSDNQIHSQVVVGANRVESDLGGP